MGDGVMPKWFGVNHLQGGRRPRAGCGFTGATRTASCSMSAQTIEFPIPVKPDEERTATHTAHYSW